MFTPEIVSGPGKWEFNILSGCDNKEIFKWYGNQITVEDITQTKQGDEVPNCADIKVNGTVQRKDIIGAIGQTEGLLGDELELRKLQRTARIGHVDVEMETKGGKVHGMIIIPSSLDNVETAIIALS